MNPNNPQIQEEDAIDIMALFFAVLSHRWIIITSIAIFSIIGVAFNSYRQDIFQTNASIIVSEDQSDPSSFINNNEYQFLYNNNLESEDHASIFKSTLILKQVVEKLDLNYRFQKKNTWKSNKVLTKESLPFEIIFKDETSQKQCIIKYQKENVIIEINDNTFSFSKKENIIENSIFKYKTKILNSIIQGTYIIDQFTVNQTINELKTKYAVNQPKKSNIYGISYSGPNKELNSSVLNGIIDEITENNVKEKKSVYKLSIDFIDKRIFDLKRKIDSLNSVISKFKITNGVYMPGTQTNSVLNNINEIEQKIFTNSLQSELSLKLINEVEKQSSFDLLPTDIGIDNKNINQMVSQFNKVILEKNNLLVGATEKNPLVIQSQNQLVVLRSNILNSLNIYTNKLKMKLNKYDDFKQKSNLMIGVIPLKEAELSNLEKDLLLVNNLYSYLSKKKEEALINLSSLEPNIKLINEVDYTVISKTSSTKTFSMFLFAGFLLPVGFTLSLFFFRAFYVDVEYLKLKLQGIDFLGVIKLTRDKTSNEVKSIQSELMKRIYHNINMKIPKSKNGLSIMVTSCIKDEGKTYTAYNFSNFLAKTGNKVILIGTDSGNPDLSKLFDNKNIKLKTKGLTDIIYDDENDFKKLFEQYKIKENQLDTLFVGTNNLSHNVFEHVKFDELISYLKEKYDYVVFDTAPVMMMVDALKLTQKSDFVIHVFRKYFSSKKLVNFLLEYNEKYKPKNIGYVVTDDTKPDKFIDKYGYGYRYGYGYGYGTT